MIRAAAAFRRVTIWLVELRRSVITMEPGRWRLLWAVVQPLLLCAQLGEGGECVEPCGRNFQCDSARCTETVKLPAQQMLSWSWDLSEIQSPVGAVDYTFTTLDESLIGVALVESSSRRKVLDKMKKNKKRTADDAGWLEGRSGLLHPSLRV